MTTEPNVLLDRMNKLLRLRNERRRRLQQVDIQVNAMVLTDTYDQRAEWATYRQALLDVTDPYKNFMSDAGSAQRLDALVVAEFEWPVEPTS